MADHGAQLCALRERGRPVRRGARLSGKARETDMSYRIVDEPGRSALEQAIVDPKWPFFASMFVGGWLAFPWFVVNAFALGGARRYGDLLISLAGLAVNAALIVWSAFLLSSMVLTEQSYPYVL